MCTSHSALLLAQSSKGNIRVCAGCAHIQLLFGNLFLAMTLAEIMQLKECLDHFPPDQYQQVPERGLVGVIRAGDTRYAFSPEEITALSTLITEAYIMLQVYETLYTK